MTPFLNKILSIFLFLLLSNSCGEFSSPNKLTTNLNPCPLGKFNGVAISYQNTRAEIDSLGASNIHIWMHWDIAEPEIFKPFLTVEDVTEEMIQAYSSGNKAGIDWSITDQYMKELEGLTIISGVGSGWKVDMPIFNGKKITPDEIGREHYLGHLYLYTRSCVRRYGAQILGWQIENEPNVALETELIGIRQGAAWKDIEFVTRVLQVLKSAVTAEDPEAWITINFHTDIHFENEIKKWLPLIDVVGIDAYPNYINGYTIRPEVVLERVKRARELSKEKPVLIMETGFATAPTVLGFSEKKQNNYIEHIYSKIEEVQGCGVFYFKLSSREENGTVSIPQENYWGLIRQDGTYKPGWHTLKKYVD